MLKQLQEIRHIKVPEDIVEEAPHIKIYDDGSVYLTAYNQGGYDSTWTNLKKLVAFLKEDAELRTLLEL